MAIKKRVKKVNFGPLFFKSKQHYLAYIINQITAKKEVLYNLAFFLCD